MTVLIKEMDGIPDMECEVTIASELKVFRSLSDLVDHVPSFLYLDKNGISISYFVDKKEVKSTRNLEIFKREFQCKTFGDLYYIVNEQSGMPSIENYEKLLAIPSVVVNYKYLQDAVHHIIFNFSRKDLERFSELILELKGLLPGFSIAYLGENRGISRTLDIMKKVPGLSYSSMKLEYDPEKIGGIMAYRWIRKIRYNTPHSVTDAFYKFEDKIPRIDGLNVVSEKHNLAQLKTHGDEMLNTIDYLEPVIMECQKNEDGVMYFDSIVMTSFYNNYLKNVMADLKSLGEGNVEVRKAGPLGEFLGYSVD